MLSRDTLPNVLIENFYFSFAPRFLVGMKSKLQSSHTWLWKSIKTFRVLGHRSVLTSTTPLTSYSVIFSFIWGFLLMFLALLSFWHLQTVLIKTLTKWIHIYFHTHNKLLISLTLSSYFFRASLILLYLFIPNYVLLLPFLWKSLLKSGVLLYYQIYFLCSTSCNQS